MMGKILRVANKVTDVVGARDLSDYASTLGAKMMVKKDARQYVPKGPSGAKALASAGNLAMSVGALSGAGALGAGIAKYGAKLSARAAAKGLAARKAVNVAEKKIVKKAVKKASTGGVKKTATPKDYTNSDILRMMKKGEASRGKNSLSRNQQWVGGEWKRQGLIK